MLSRIFHIKMDEHKLQKMGRRILYPLFVVIIHADQNKMAGRCTVQSRSNTTTKPARIMEPRRLIVHTINPTSAQLLLLRFLLTHDQKGAVGLTASPH